MELSSPLPALQPPAFGHRWANGGELAASQAFFPPLPTFGTGSFNFKDLSMKKPCSDYFTGRPVRGSSPAASLAADLSQNFHIDRSPRPQTPRRSLFTSKLFQLPADKEGTTTPPIGWEAVTTPPVPSSSPSCGPDSMDYSPLPHKPPFALSTKVAAETPPTDCSLNDEAMLSPCEIPVNAFKEGGSLACGLERKKQPCIRPSLTRVKGFSTNTLSLKGNGQECLPPFKFGAGSNTSIPTATSLSECFAESPQQDRKMLVGLPQMGPPRPRQSLSGGSCSSRGNGSPVTNHVRKPAGRSGPPRKQFRRSLSMFESPGDVLVPEKKEYTPSGLQSIMDVDEIYRLKLPHFVPENEPDSLPRINKDTLIDVLNGDFDHMFDQKILVDCRFEYEYSGGHIEGAFNYNDKELLAAKLFDVPSPSNTLLIFHCEYSAHRAPIMAKFVRHKDRALNDFQYPKLTYPEVYILDGGYSSFFKAHQTRCFPQNYVEMDAKEHERACEKGLNKLRQRAKLGRAQTFAFGQRACPMEDSPTAPARSEACIGAPPSLAIDSVFDSRRLHTRRMASY